MACARLRLRSHPPRQPLTPTSTVSDAPAVGRATMPKRSRKGKPEETAALGHYSNIAQNNRNNGFALRHHAAIFAQSKGTFAWKITISYD